MSGGTSKRFVLPHSYCAIATGCHGPTPQCEDTSYFASFRRSLSFTMTKTFPKPPSRKSEKRRARRARNAHIATVRREVALRDRRCRRCGEYFGIGEFTPEMHEIQSRAALKGRPVEDIFNLDNCVMLHRKCHREITEHKAVCP